MCVCIYMCVHVCMWMCVYIYVYMCVCLYVCGVYISVCVCVCVCILIGFPGGLDSKESACHAGDPGSIPGLRRSLGEGNGNPLQYSCLQNSMERGALQATVHGVAKG